VFDIIVALSVPIVPSVIPMTHLWPQPSRPRRDADPNDEFAFTAKLASEDPLNEGRDFVVRLSLSSDEVKVWENDSPGFRGGFFFKSPMDREPGKFNPAKGFIGAQITINRTKFLLVGAPESTLSFMEARPDIFPLSDLSLIMQNLRKKFTADQIRPKFTAFDSDKTGRILMKDAFSVLSEPEFGLTRHEQITITRRYRFYKTDRFLYEDFLSGV
jgi:hypothetical protein